MLLNGVPFWEISELLNTTGTLTAGAATSSFTARVVVLRRKVTVDCALNEPPEFR